MPEYQYLVADLLTDTIREEMPFTSVSYGDVLNAPGAFSGKLPLSLKNTAGFEKITRANLDPGKTALYVKRDGVIVWSGIIWTVTADEDSFSVTIGAEGFWSYFRRRLVRVSKKYTAKDQLFITRDLINYAQSITGGNLGIVVGSETSGVNRDLTLNSWDRPVISTQIEDLSALTNGFDFSIITDDASGSRVRTLHLYYPKRGARLAHVLDLGTNIEALSWEIDATKQANLIDAIGSGDGALTVISTASDTSLIGSYPLLEDTVSFKDVTVRNTLSAHATATLAATKKPLETLPTLVAHGTSDLVIGSFGVGDELEVRTQNAGGFLSIDSIHRMLSWTVKIDDTNGRETIDFALVPTEALV